MSIERKFIRTVYLVEIISEKRMPKNADCQDLYEATTEIRGVCPEASGLVKRIAEEKISSKKLVEHCSAHGTDPEFFALDPDGNDLDYE